MRNLIIRFKPFGRTHAIKYRVVLAQKQRAVNKLHIEDLGHYDPKTKVAVLKTERLQELLNQNVEVSESAASLLKKNNLVAAK